MKSIFIGGGGDGGCVGLGDDDDDGGGVGDDSDEGLDSTLACIRQRRHNQILSN